MYLEGLGKSINFNLSNRLSGTKENNNAHSQRSCPCAGVTTGYIKDRSHTRYRYITHRLPNKTVVVITTGLIIIFINITIIIILMNTNSSNTVTTSVISPTSGRVYSIPASLNVPQLDK
jgi:hypothetical protein